MSVFSLMQNKPTLLRLCLEGCYLRSLMLHCFMSILEYVTRSTSCLNYDPCGLFVVVSTRSMASKTSVGFVGLGNMGNPMAKNLLKHGYPVIATDVFPESCKEVQELGAQVGGPNIHTLCFCFFFNFKHISLDCSLTS